MAEDINKLQNDELDWDSVIEDDDRPDYLILDEGDYNFVVTKFERSRYEGSAKSKACNMVKLTLQIQTENGPAYVFHNLYMKKTNEWMFSQFFRSIGQKKRGEKLKMNWNTVTGSKGHAHIKPRVYTSSNGQERKANNIDYFIDYDPKFFDTDTGFMPAPEDDGAIPFD